MDMNKAIPEVVKSNWHSIASFTIIAFLVGIVVGFYYTHNYYEKKLDASNTKLASYESMYSTVQAEREKAIIAKAIAEDKANKPIYVPVKGDTVTEVRYAEKESSTDADASLTTAPTSYKFEYNGKKFDLPNKSEDGSTIKDGKLVLTQSSTAVLNVDDIVNREIANTINKKDKEIAVQKRQKIQNTIWGALIGVGVGSFIK